jgi:hypothetical protein
LAWSKEEPIMIGETVDEITVYVMVKVDTTPGKSPDIKVTGVYIGNKKLKRIDEDIELVV